jgi:hypothetical protein
MSALISILVETFVKWGFNFLPPLIVRWLLPPEKLAKKISLQLSSGQSIKFHHQNGICAFEAWLVVHNKSALRCIIDRVILRLDGLSSVNEFVCLLPITIEPLGEGKLYVRRILSEPEVNAIKQYFDAGNRLSSPHLRIDAVISSPIGLILKNEYPTYSGEITNPFVR